MSLLGVVFAEGSGPRPAKPMANDRTATREIHEPAPDVDLPSEVSTV